MSPLNSIGRKAVQAFDELGQAPASRRVFVQETESGSTFPYGSEWFFGYTLEKVGELWDVSIHNVALHYHSGIIQEQTTPYTFTLGVDIPFDEMFGFSVDFTTGVFSLVVGDEALANSTYGSAFTFPIYQFTEVSGAPSMAIDYIHGSNLAW